MSSRLVHTPILVAIVAKKSAGASRHPGGYPLPELRYAARIDARHAGGLRADKVRARRDEQSEVPGLRRLRKCHPMPCHSQHAAYPQQV